MESSLTALFVWKRVVEMGYPCLESYLSARDMADECLMVVDPTGPETVELVDAICSKDKKARRIDFTWPEKSPDGGAIGLATAFGWANIRTSHGINIQGDECYPPELTEWVADSWSHVCDMGYTCIRFKVLNTEFNASQFQGGEKWDGIKFDENGNMTDMWRRGGMFNGKVGGAGYNVAVKLAKKCPSIKVAHDAWSFNGCEPLYHAQISDTFPILHLHDFARDHYIAIRRNAGDNLWDSEQYRMYKATADSVEATKDQWWNDPAWVAKTSPFEELMPSYMRGILGCTSYRVRYELLG